MSDIQEEQKRLYKKAEENDRKINDGLINDYKILIQNWKNKYYETKEERDNLQDRIDKAIEIIKKYGYEKQMEEDYLMNRVNLANYNCLLLDILQGDNK